MQFSIDESLEFNLNLVDGGVPGAQTVSQQLKAIDFTKLPYTCVTCCRCCQSVEQQSSCMMLCMLQATTATPAMLKSLFALPVAWTDTSLHISRTHYSHLVTIIPLRAGRMPSPGFAPS